MLDKINHFLDILDINHIAFETGFCKRESRKISPSDFLKSFFICFSKSKYSLRNWSVVLSSLIGQFVSFQAIDKKIQFQKVDFVKKLFSMACSVNLNKFTAQYIGDLSKFGRVIIQDSTLVKLSDKHYEHTSGVSNGLVKKALSRIQSTIDLAMGKFIDVVMCTYSQNDAAFAGNIISLIKPNDLILRDLGYFGVSVLSKIHQANAFFISKLHGGILVIDFDSEQRIDLVEFIKSNERKGVTSFDLAVKIGEKEKYPVRMVGYRVTEEQALKKRRKLKDSRHKDCGISNKAIFLCNYNIFITNIPKDKIAANKLFEIYSLRWSVELMFKEWKSIFDLNRLMFSNKTPNPARPEMLLYMMLLYIAVVVKPSYFKIAAIIKQKYKRYLSPHKFSNFLKTVFSLDLDLESEFYLEQMCRICCYDKRSDRNHFALLLEKFVILS
jgi:hypothetical protein